MSTYEELSLIISIALLIVAILIIRINKSVLRTHSRFYESVTKHTFAAPGAYCEAIKYTTHPCASLHEVLLMSWEGRFSVTVPFP